ncbi:WD40 repeat-like protein, partial [Lentinus brumalis]
GHEDLIDHLTVSPDGMWVATFSEDQTIILWSTKDGSAALELTPRAAIQGDTPFSPDSKHLGMYCKDRRSRRTGTAGGSSDASSWQHHRPRWLTLFFPDGTKVLSYVRSYYTSSRSHPAIVSVWNTTTGGHILSLEAHARDVSVVAISPDGEYIAIASSRPVNLRVWRARVGTCLGVFTEHSVEVTHLMFSRDGETLCSASKDGYVCIRRMREIVSRG